MKSSNYIKASNNPSPAHNLVFPDTSLIEIKTSSVSLKEIITLSERMLPINNKKREKSKSSSYTAFVL